MKYKELIAVAVAHTVQCPYCIDSHAGNARKAGVSDAELVEAAMVKQRSERERQLHTRPTLSLIE